ncbi:40S ribosomal protein S3 (nucleomorph) [Guillardia theta]|uniref:40S ribosomal protein S3 n=1 Tax=Guillardia theta TaxID=55529 RepID=Q98S35_GUITH|nr:40S ribosomal protein S3 [Guillardia theta]AAK39747.1 40S ribosomal protein S3 [Guillardia theta]|mmetsp:Transcript_24128/g.78545  ORF Transcript_24128/g.78545 Transcript_24128/m.78545 type:complete len:219 (-) Transcript_24128:3433-4089(-)
MLGYRLSLKKKFVADGVVYSEINEFLERELKENGFSGIKIKKKIEKVEIIIKSSKAHTIIGFKGKRIRELNVLLKKRFNFGENKLVLYVEKINNRNLCPINQAESLRYKILRGFVLRKACYSILRSTIEAGAKGCIISVSGKLRAQRAKTMKFMDGYIIHSGKPSEEYTKSAIRHCLLPQGVIGIKISIMLPWDPCGLIGPKKPLPDVITLVQNRTII